MPIFEFHCINCNTDFEVLVLGRQEITCPACNSNNVTKLLSSFRHKSDRKFSGLKGSACSTCSATSCSTCGK
ncbi:MAG: zinc ribbon domain-containing protein [Deltaproteobacteria bacterium]|nr:zinc ribbon domain-containing protein [Deltaproteobacteria bacterium]